MNRAGMIQSIMGNRIFTGNFAAISSAFWARCTRMKSAWVRRASAMLVPIFSDCSIRLTKDLTLCTPVRSARFFKAVSREAPVRSSALVNCSSLIEVLGYAPDLVGHPHQGGLQSQPRFHGDDHQVQDIR